MLRLLNYAKHYASTINKGLPIGTFHFLNESFYLGQFFATRRLNQDQTILVAAKYTEQQCGERGTFLLTDSCQSFKLLYAAFTSALLPGNQRSSQQNFLIREAKCDTKQRMADLLADSFCCGSSTLARFAQQYQERRRNLFSHQKPGVLNGVNFLNILRFILIGVCESCRKGAMTLSLQLIIIITQFSPPLCKTKNPFLFLSLQL